MHLGGWRCDAKAILLSIRQRKYDTMRLPRVKLSNLWLYHQRKPPINHLAPLQPPMGVGEYQEQGRPNRNLTR